jgi:hypothetical protein
MREHIEIRDANTSEFLYIFEKKLGCGRRN